MAGAINEIEQLKAWSTGIVKNKRRRSNRSEGTNGYQAPDAYFVNLPPARANDGMMQRTNTR